MKALLFFIILLTLFTACELQTNGKLTDGSTATADAVTLPLSLTTSCTTTSVDGYVSGLDNCDGSIKTGPRISVKWKDGGACANLSTSAKTIVSGTVGVVTSGIQGALLDNTGISAPSHTLTYDNGATTLPFGEYCMMVLIDLDNNGISVDDPILAIDVVFSSDVVEDAAIGAITATGAVSGTVGGASAANRNKTAVWVKATAAYQSYWNN